MKFISLSMFVFVIIGNLHGQVKTSKISTTKSFGLDSVFYKQSGERVDPMEAMKMINSNTGESILEHVINQYGEITKSYIDTTRAESSSSFAVQLGDKFPNLIVELIDGRQIDLSEQIGKTIILRFEISSNMFDFEKPYIKSVESKIQTTFSAGEFVSLLFFEDISPDILKKPGYNTTPFSVVRDAKWFSEKLNLKRFPTTFVIDPKGLLKGVYQGTEVVRF